MGSVWAYVPTSQGADLIPGCAGADGFYTASASCTYNGGTIDIQDSNGMFTARFGAPLNPPANVTIAWVDLHDDAVTVTGPVTPTSLVFYLTNSPGDFLGGVTCGVMGEAPAAFLGYTPGTHTAIYDTVCGYDGGPTFFRSLFAGSISYTPWSTINYSSILLGVDALDANGHSLAGIDQFTFARGLTGVANYSSVPEPHAFVLLGTSLVGLGAGVLRKKWRP